MKEAQGVPDPAIRLDKPVNDIFRYLDIVPVILLCYPEPHDLGAVFVDDLIGDDDIAKRFGHLPP